MARIVLGLVIFPCLQALGEASPISTGQRPELAIPRIDHPPRLEEFLGEEPGGQGTERLAMVDNFIQEEPRDGEPSSQVTRAYLCYDEKNLYVIFVALDSEPDQIRARMARREDAFDDDFVEVTLDTFNDQRRGYMFACNPLGIQGDGTWTEGQGLDFSFDTLWHSRGQVTDSGYVVWMQIPFKSLRFSSDPQQVWGITLMRRIQRANEFSWWPRVSSRIEGRLNQAATVRGLERISPGRNIQLIPYGVFRAFKTLDVADPARPRFITDYADPDAGLDAKFVLKDSLVLDVAVNPDFSQVESDEPQVTVNQRFEVYFPEKRPFFLENANYFETPINLLFTRRIADPQFGVRLTGKLDRFALGALVIDDESPGKLVPKDNPLSGKRARYAIFRGSRDILRQSTVGAMYIDTKLVNSYNRVGGVDGRFKLGQNWIVTGQAITSATQSLDGSRLAGPAYYASASYDSRQLYYDFEYHDVSPGFRTQSGFVPRPDIREIEQSVRYEFRPEGKWLISWGPRLFMNRTWDHQGTRLNWLAVPELQWDFNRKTFFSLFYAPEAERFRPQDFPGLSGNLDFRRNTKGIEFGTEYIQQVSVFGEFHWGQRVHLDPPAGQAPLLANRTSGELNVTLRPITPLRLDNSYLLFRLTDRSTGDSIFNNHIIRTRLNWQFNRELSLRVILQYDALLANPPYTSLTTTKNLNTDFLVTYLVNPGTALAVGNNFNRRNIDLWPNGPGNGSEIVRTSKLMNDARGLFIKFSYLFRF